MAAAEVEIYHNVTAYSQDKEIELYFDSEQYIHINLNFPWTTLNLVMFVLNNLTVITVNVLVLIWLKLKERTLVDRMVLLDCLANIGMIGVMFLAFPVRVWGNTHLCLLITFFRVFVLSLNRLGTVAMLQHRYIVFSNRL